MEDRDIGEKSWSAAEARGMENVDMDEIGGAVEGGEVNIGYLNVEGSLYTGGTIEPRVGIGGSSLRTGNCGVSSSVLRCVAPLELKTLPLDFVLARDQIFSANEAALPILPLFLGESEGNEKERVCECALC